MTITWGFYFATDRQVTEEAREAGRVYRHRFNREARTQQLRAQTIQEFYGHGQAIMQEISSPFHLPGDYSFAWSAWNLFQGWKETYRTDDPSKVALRQGISDFSEKKKPYNFDPQLWDCVKALNRAIQALKTNRRNVDLEAQANGALEDLRTRWVRMNRPQRPHPFHATEWVEQGRIHGHLLYCVAPED